MLDPARSYDLIGDVHGCAHTLEHLLDQMGYHKQGGTWRHPSRMAVFLGDIIDRGPRIREALHIVHDMAEAGQALCIMGNHEFNALGWATPAPPGSGRQFVREHNPRHARLIHETLTQFEHHPADWPGLRCSGQPLRREYWEHDRALFANRDAAHPFHQPLPKRPSRPGLRFVGQSKRPASGENRRHTRTPRQSAAR